MTVRELIEHLQTLDPERNVWVIYDSFMTYEPDFSATITEEEAMYLDSRVSEGDYKMEVG